MVVRLGGEIVIHFSERLKFSALFDKWCSENNVSKAPINVIVFLQNNGLITEERFRQFLKDNPVEL